MVKRFCESIDRRVGPVVAGLTLIGGSSVIHGCRLECLGVMAGITLAGIGYVRRVLSSGAGKKIGAVMTGGALSSDAGNGVVHNCTYECGE